MFFVKSFKSSVIDWLSIKGELWFKSSVPYFFFFKAIHELIVGVLLWKWRVLVKFTLLPLVFAKQGDFIIYVFVQNHCYKVDSSPFSPCKAQVIFPTKSLLQSTVCGARLCVRDSAYMPGTRYNFFEKLWSRQKTLHFWGGENTCRTKQVILIWGRYDIQSSIMEFAHLLKTILYTKLRQTSKSPICTRPIILNKSTICILSLTMKQVNYYLWVLVNSTGKIFDSCKKDLGFNFRLHQKLIRFLV